MNSPKARSERMQLVETALGKQPFDLIITHVQGLNVFTGTVDPGALGIKAGRIVTTQAVEGAASLKTVDGQGCYALPGLMDTHVHIDSTLLTPEGMAELVVPHGTTALFADPMEISNVAGVAGLQVLFQRARRVPCRVYLEIPSRVPTAPGLETTGGEIGLQDVKRLLKWKVTVSLGELDPSKVLGLREEYFLKVEAALAAGKIANGHTAGLRRGERQMYACAGLCDDHECVTFEDALECMSLGMAVLIREGSTERNLEALVKGILAHGVDTHNWMMCTDDKHPNELRDEGHIDYMVNKAIRFGLPPITAIQMATINAARHFRMDHEIGSLAPGRRADIILSRKLDEIIPERVFVNGELAAENGALVRRLPRRAYPAWIRSTVKITRGLKAADFRLETGGDQAKLHVIAITPDQIVNTPESAVLPIRAGAVQNDIPNGVNKLSVVERYGKNGNIGITFIRGFGLQRGALGITVSHDHHNLVIVGADDESMATCARKVQEMQGGLVAADGDRVLASMPLPVGGLMSDQPVEQVITGLEAANAAAQSLGCPLPAPFMSLSFVSLPTVPELGLTDKGLIDVRGHRIISPFVQG